ncbi:unnamed protein product [Clavelina lepadiformis]|uniref:Adenine DNA glycosylase n=1 Tax=Clavelina lepadiformis TaxID=159417 RepID=A0ABP0H029_CLALP
MNVSYKFSLDEVESMRYTLLAWYDAHKRQLPWREYALTCSDANSHAYAVWVSEIMLQQTRVATVIDYYKRWMMKWPDLKSLSQASEEEVNHMWSGLGYYSRGRRLLQGAIKVTKEFGGNMPTKAALLMKELPGVGRYTSSAISSIAFSEPVGVVDGNVTRVLCRMRAIGGNTTKKEVMSHLWSVANHIVHQERPGDFNQALMELGAMICLPKNPKCSSCPVKSNCKSLRQVEEQSKFFFNKKMKKLLIENKPAVKKEDGAVLIDIENCADPLALPECEPWDPQQGVMNYPRKPKKKIPRNDYVAVTVLEWISVECQPSVVNANMLPISKLLIVQRPNTGLLAGLWEFPSKPLNSIPESLTIFTNQHCKRKQKRSELNHFDDSSSPDFKQLEKLVSKSSDVFLRQLLTPKSYEIKNRMFVGCLDHLFSHIHQTNYIEHITLNSVDGMNLDLAEKSNAKWTECSRLQESAISSVVSKIYKNCLCLKQQCKKEQQALKGTRSYKKRKVIQSDVNAVYSVKKQKL